MRSRGLPTTGLASALRGHRRQRPRGQRPCCSTRRSPTGFVCASDTLAMGVLHTLAERGLVAGRDVAVVGFDDSQVAQVVPPGLTSVRQPLEEVAVEIVRALEGLLDPPAHPRPAASCSTPSWSSAAPADRGRQFTGQPVNLTLVGRSFA